MKTYDAIVVGAGPAGAAAALTMARAGLKVLLLERGDAPGAKNMFGGMMPRCVAVEELIPSFLEEAPWERHVVKRMLTVISEGSSTSMAFTAENFDRPPYNGFTLFRPLFDNWLAKKAEEEGAVLLTRCLVTGLIMENGTVKGVRMGSDEVYAPVTILCDGVLSLLGKRAGFVKVPKASDMAVGMKALYFLGENEINERFGLVRRQGATQEFLGCTEGVRGGGFMYTQMETLSMGLVFHLDSLKDRGIAPYDLNEKFTARDDVKRILKGARLLEYSAHVLPEGGINLVPKVSQKGLLIAGDAAALCYTNGLNQEGMNLAITSGWMAGKASVEALGKGNPALLARYEEELRESFVLRDMRSFAKTVDLMHNDRLFGVYPNLVGTILEELYKSDGKPRKKMGRLGYDALREALPMKDIISDIVKGGKSLL